MARNIFAPHENLHAQPTQQPGFMGRAGNFMGKAGNLLSGVDPSILTILGANMMAASQKQHRGEGTASVLGRGILGGMGGIAQHQSQKQRSAYIDEQIKTSKAARELQMGQLEQNRKSATNLYNTVQKKVTSQQSEGGLEVTPREQALLDAAEYGMLNPAEFGPGAYKTILSGMDEDGSQFKGTGFQNQAASKWAATQDDPVAAAAWMSQEALMRPRTMTDASGNSITLPGIDTSAYQPQQPGAAPIAPTAPTTTTALGAPAQKASKTFGRLGKSFTGYKKLLKDIGPRYLASGGKLRLESGYRDLLLEMKELYNLGVLNGPDLEIMEDILKNPTGLFTNLAESAGLLTVDDMVAAMDETVGSKINTAVDKANELYGLDLPYVETAAPSAVQSGPVTVQSEAEALALPEGTKFVLPDGRTGTVR